jgi:sugar lactone lactonase YvrE
MSQGYLMSKLASFSSNRTASRATVRLAFPALLLAGTLGVFITGCGGPGYVYGGPGYPCYMCGGYYGGYGGYGGYGYGYGGISTSPITGNSVPGNSGNGAASSASAALKPTALAIDSSGNLYIADQSSNTVRELATSSGTLPSAAPFPHLTQLSAVAIGPSGNLYVLDQASGTVRRISTSSGSIALVAGSRAGFSGDNGQATSAQFNLPAGMAFDPSGNLFIADTGNNRIREIAASTGIITTIAGNGTAGYSGDNGRATSASLNQPSAVAADSNGNLYIADTANSAIRKVDTQTGIITTITGNGTAGFSGDNGPASAAQLDQPRGITVDPIGNLFIADTGNQSIREVPASTGTIFTIAGNQTAGYTGDGGLSYKAELDSPYATVIDVSTGNLYIADYGNGIVRKVLPSPAPTTAAN